MKNCTRALGVVLVGCSLLLGIACGSGGSSYSSPSATAAPAGSTAKVNAEGTLTNDQGWPRVEGLRGKRYCEVLLASILGTHLNAAVWNTYGLNDCPDAAWKALDANAIKTERGVVAALLNGPRYWLMDAIEKKPSGERQVATFGTIEMFLAATVDLGPIPPNTAPYAEHAVARETVFEYAKGAEIFELTAADGKVYVMQSYSQQIDSKLTEADLAGLATRLKLPAGWTFRVRTTGNVFRVLAPGGQAVVIQDDFMNTYQLIAPS